MGQGVEMSRGGERRGRGGSKRKERNRESQVNNKYWISTKNKRGNARGVVDKKGEEGNNTPQKRGEEGWTEGGGKKGVGSAQREAKCGRTE